MTTTATEHHTLALGKIAQHPHNPRREVGDVSDLANSIKAVGILQDLTVAPWPTDVDDKKPRAADYVLIAGHRRLAAARSAGLKQVPVKVIAVDSLAEQLEAMIVENLQRSDLTPVEEAHAYQQLLDLKVPVKAIASTTGQTQTRVRDRLKLTRIPEAVQDLTHAGQITLTDALAFDEFKDDEQALADLAAAVGTNDWGHTVNRVRAAKENDRRFADRVRTIEAKGVRFLTEVELAVLVDDEGDRTYRSLSSYLPGVDYVYDWSHDADATAAKHAACAGHAAQALSESRIVRYYCLTPDVHTARPANDDTEPAETDEAAAERQRQFEEAQRAREARRLDLDAAHRTRLDHIASIIKAGPSDGLALDCLRQPLVERSDDSGWWGSYDADVISNAGLLLDIDTSWVRTHDDARQALLEAFWPDALDGLAINQIAVLLDALWHTPDEDDLTNGQWAPSEPGRAWFDRLTDVYGYTPSTFELDCITAADPADADGADS